MRIAFKQKAPRQMAQYVDVFIFHRANDALGVLRLVQCEPLMRARDDHVQLGEQVVRKIQFTLGQNVHFRAGEQAEISAFIGELFV